MFSEIFPVRILSVGVNCECKQWNCYAYLVLIMKCDDVGSQIATAGSTIKPKRKLKQAEQFVYVAALTIIKQHAATLHV